jgi:hypothetical protein
MINPCLNAGKSNRGLKLSRNSRTLDNDHLHIYSLWSGQPFARQGMTGQKDGEMGRNSSRDNEQKVTAQRAGVSPEDPN